MNKGDGAPCPGIMRIAYVRAYPVWGGSTFVVKSTGSYPAAGVDSDEVSAAVWPGMSRPSGPPFVGSPGSRGPSRGSARLGGVSPGSNRGARSGIAGR